MADKCRTCVYRCKTGSYITCDYILIEEQHRPCPPNNECTVYQRGPAKSNLSGDSEASQGRVYHKPKATPKQSKQAHPFGTISDKQRGAIDKRYGKPLTDEQCANVNAYVRLLGTPISHLAKAIGIRASSMDGRVWSKVQWREPETHRLAELYGVDYDDLINGRCKIEQKLAELDKAKQKAREGMKELTRTQCRRINTLIIEGRDLDRRYVVKLAEKMGVSPDYINRRKRNVHRWRMRDVEKLCEVLGVTEKYILEGR